MTNAPIDTVADIAPDPNSPAGIAARWISELEQSQKFQRTYINRCGKINERYKDKKAQLAEGTVKRKFAVLWSNIETLKPACYARLPVCVVTRKFNDADPVARVSSEVLERAIKNSLDNYDFDQVLKSIRDDFLLFARGVPWIRYEADFDAAIKPDPETDDDEAIAEKETEETEEDEASETPEHEMAEGEVVTDERTICDHVSLDDFGTNTARTWSEVRFVWRRAYLTREALQKRFTAKVPGMNKTIGDIVPLDWKPDDSQTTDLQKTEMFSKAQIYEVWDKESKKVFWISKSYPASPLDMRDDPLKLRDFFPCTKPAYGTLANDSVIPIPDYIFYQDQAEEVDDLTMRIGLLQAALRMVGMYAGDERPNLQQVFKASSENQMIPVDTWAAFQEKGGIKGVVEWVPVDMVIQVLKGLFETRKQIMDDIYQITGISDIMRGDTVASETATAQQIKSTWGSSRVREKQKEIARVARDIMRIMGEIIAERYGIETLERITNVKLLREAEKQQIMQWQQAVQALQARQQQMQAMAQQQQPQGALGQPAPPQPPMPQMQPPPPPFPEDKMKLMAQPTWEEVKELLENEGKRMFRIDVEADSTIDADMQQQQAAATQYVTAMGSLISEALPAVQQAPPLGEFLGEVVKAVGRLYPFGRQFEEVIDRTMDNIAKMPPQADEKAKPEATQKGKSPEELMIESQKLQVKREEIAQRERGDQLEAQTKVAESMDNKEIEMAKVAQSDREARMDDVMRRMEAFLNSQDRRYEIDNAPIPNGGMQ